MTSEGKGNKRGFVQDLKRLCYPLRIALGKAAISPLEQRVAALESSVHRLRLERLLIYKAASLIAADKIEGDYLEFGVYRGDSFTEAFKCIQTRFHEASTSGAWNTQQDCDVRRAIWERMRFFAFDSFQGLPQISGLDALSHDFTEGKFACSEEEFRRIIVSQGISADRVVTIPGWFQYTLDRSTIEKYNIRKAAIVYVDCDLYESAKVVLDFVTDLLVDGAVIIFDDWYNFTGNPNLGEQRAFREWSQSHPELLLTQFQKQGAWKNSFLVHKVTPIAAQT